MGQDDRRRGRPRSDASRRAILAAANELLLRRGVDAVSMDAIAEAAGASKATIYRWWPSKHLLALEALLQSWEAMPMRDTGSLREDLRSLLRQWVRRARPHSRVIAALLAEVHRDAAFGQAWRELFFEARRGRGRAAFSRAIERGEIPATTDVELGLDMLFGPLYHRLLHGHQPLSASVADRVVDAVLHGIAD